MKMFKSRVHFSLRKENIKSKLVTLLALILSGLVASCLSTPPSNTLLPAKTFKLVQNAVFEVVLDKPAEDSIVYEREPDWDLVPFTIRNDKYYSIGTAFAISQTELITAFHVINLGYESMVLNKFYIRDSQGNIFEVDKITGGSNEKDYLIFTVKDKTFNEYFQLERKYNVGDVVFSIGNALGEGIVIRNGLILGTVPEEDSGRWDLLKSSADGNPGNSGGPLVTPDGRVVAVVTALRENILYSTPAETILNDSRAFHAHRNKGRFGHLILSNNYMSIFETSVPLPDTYTGVRQKIREAYVKYYNDSMSGLFNEAPEYLTGEDNIFLLNSSISSIFPSISYVDPNDNNWKLSSLNHNTQNLKDNGRLLHASASGFSFYKLIKPDSASIQDACTNPKFIMDLVLQNIRTERTLWGNNKYRILSYGDPSSTGVFKDSLGRTWLTAYWTIGFDDSVNIMYILPTPDGPVVITTRQNSALLMDYEWDLQRLCEHIFPAYNGSFKQWEEFFILRDYIPEFLKDMRFTRNRTDQSFVFSSGSFTVNADKNIFNWNDNSEIFLAPVWYKQNNKLEFGLRRIVLRSDSRGREYAVIYKNTKPDSRLGTNIMENWNDLTEERFPFDGRPVISARENTGSIGAIIAAKHPEPDVLYSIYLSMENPQSEENLSRRFNAFRTGVSIER